MVLADLEPVRWFHLQTVQNPRAPFPIVLKMSSRLNKETSKRSFFHRVLWCGGKLSHVLMTAMTTDETSRHM